RGDGSWSDVDAAVERIVATLLRFESVLSAPAPPADVLGSPEHRALAREVAARSVVLLRNEPVDGAPVLPLPPDARVAVLGRLASRGFGLSRGGDRTSLRLHGTDVELIRAVAAANPRTVVAIQAGSAVVVSEWIDSVPAVLQTWYGGCRAGPGLADVLFGAVN